jgi:phosphatidylserine/phosphatidylglycerophosphate/cardiolipin synthase-like enzyme
MAKFLNTSKAYAAIEDIISKASNRVVLISPYLQIPETLLKRLKYIDGKGIKIIVVCKKDDLKADVRSDLKQLKKLELRFDEHLHAKCFYNEESMVITSLNLYEYSQQHNREMGILLSLKDDPDVFNEARNEAEFIVSEAEKGSLIRSVFSEVVKDAKSILDSTVKDDSRTTRRTSKPGFCIRCGTPIPYNLDSPYCRDCWEKWKEGGGNPDYRERDGKCHACGEPALTKMAKPLCDSCYEKSRR